MTYDSQEKSAQGGRPVEIYTFTAPTFTYRFTSYDEDVVFGGNTFTAIAIEHGNATKVPIGQTRELIVTMPRTHELVGKLRNNGIPVRGIEVRIESFHSPDAPTASREVWRGDVAGVETDNQHAKLRVPSATDDRMNVRLPIVQAQRQCNHALYDRGCTVSRLLAANFINTAVNGAPVGVTIVVDSLGANPNGWAKGGDIVRTADGERRSVVEQVGTTITIDVPFATLADNDEVQVFAGCDWLIDTCLTKFDNVDNFGGHNEMPMNNPTAPTGYGVVSQS